jgi:Ca-activated chloride channel family protein
MRSEKNAHILTLLASLIFGSVHICAQHKDPTRAATFGVTSELVAIPVTVTDRNGHTVVGLRADDFVIAENGVVQRVQSVSRWDVPVSICVVFDASGSMKRGMHIAQTALRKLLDGSGPDDEACLIRFAGKPELLADFTYDTAEIPNELLWDRPRGATSLVDAVYAGLVQMRRASNSRRALVVITDAGENNSRYSFQELLSLARETDVQVYAVAIRGDNLNKEEQRGRVQLDRIAEETGGEQVVIDSTSRLPPALETINELIRNQYLLTYRPPDSARDGKWRAVRVQLHADLMARRYRVNSRRGYFALRE